MGLFTRLKHWFILLIGFEVKRMKEWFKLVKFKTSDQLAYIYRNGELVGIGDFVEL